jgi:hypothetical protein
MKRNYAQVPFERYADDILIHCESKEQAEQVLDAVRQRLKECRLELNDQKTKIVHCPNGDPHSEHEHVAFDFLGYTFRPRLARSRTGKRFWGFIPAVSNAAAKRIRQKVRQWRLTSRVHQTLEELAELIDPCVLGWMEYYGRYYRSECVQVLRYINRSLAKWVRRKYKVYRRHNGEAEYYLGRLARRRPGLLALWRMGIKPPIRMRRT